MPRRTLVESRVLITGASSGIGRALALALVQQRARVMLVARREEKLNDLAAEITAAQGTCLTLVGDVTQPATRQQALEEVQQAWGGLDVLINNAGVGAFGRFESADPTRLRRVMEVNFFALVEMTRAALPLLKTGVQPLIVNMGSILGHRAIPLSSEYCASKFAVQGFSQSLRAELHPLGIDVLVVSPGTTDTEFTESVLERNSATPWKQGRGVPATQVARATVRAMLGGRHEIVPNHAGRALVLANRLSPRLLDWWMQRYG